MKEIDRAEDVANYYTQNKKGALDNLTDTVTTKNAAKLLLAGSVVFSGLVEAQAIHLALNTQEFRQPYSTEEIEKIQDKEEKYTAKYINWATEAANIENARFIETRIRDGLIILGGGVGISLALNGIAKRKEKEQK